MGIAPSHLGACPLMSRSVGEMPLFTKTSDYLGWLIRQVEHFPKLYRDTVTRRLLDAALDFQEAILMANSQRSERRMVQLEEADHYLDKIRLYMRLAYRLRWFNDGQYEHGSRMLTEMGKLVGGWRRITKDAIAER